MTEALQAKFIQLRKAYIAMQYKNLNEMQQQAVCATEGPLLILAGAGSGKTTVLVNRIANMVRYGSACQSDYIPPQATQQTVDELEQAVKTGGRVSEQTDELLAVRPVRPYHILAITFTNKAAGEMKERIGNILGEQAQDIQASTFHSACVRILRREAEYLGYPSGFTIYDTEDQKRVMKEVYKALAVDDKFLPAKSCLGAIGRLKDKLVSPKEAEQNAGDTRTGLVAKVYASYQQHLRAAGAMDFDDLIYNTVKLLQEQPERREYYQNRFRYILVDEYQDTSIAQFMLVYLLGEAHHNVCVVGDDDQSIYRFRGATIENILNFGDHFPHAQVVRLEENYRSTANILNAANGVIKHNHGRKGKTLWTQNDAGTPILCYTADNEYDEAAQVAAIIGNNLRAGAALHDHAVLYRMNAQSNPLETYFARAGIPYRIIGGHRFYDRKEVKDITAYMSIVANRKDDVRLRRIINEPARKIGLTTQEKISAAAQQNELCMLDVIQRADEFKLANEPLRNFYSIYTQLVQAEQTLPLDSFVNELITITGYRAYLENAGEEGKTRLENLGQLVSAVKTYADQKGPEASLAGYLEEIALINDIDSYDENTDAVVLMTMHTAKGLEFPYVFIVGMEEGIFPGDMARFSDDDMEEERRLCYVGITRAKKDLYLMCAASRMLFGQTKRNAQSRFIDEIDPALLDRQGGRQQTNHSVFSHSLTFQDGGGAVSASRFGSQPIYAPRSAPAAYAPRPAAQPMPRVTVTETAAAPEKPKASAPQYKVGDKVEHKVFGSGTVRKVTPIAGDCIVEVEFSIGIKRTMANYAPMRLA